MVPGACKTAVGGWDDAGLGGRARMENGPRASGRGDGQDSGRSRSDVEPWESEDARGQIEGERGEII